MQLHKWDKIFANNFIAPYKGSNFFLPTWSVCADHRQREGIAMWGAFVYIKSPPCKPGADT